LSDGLPEYQSISMISLQKGFLFVHIPKTAGNSIQTILAPYSEDEIVAVRGHQDGIERFGLRNPNYKLKKHSTLAEYRATLGEEQFRSFYKFTCVRNPWDRMVSYYFTAGRQMVKWDRKAFKKMILKALSAANYLQLEEGEVDPFGNVNRILRFETLGDDFNRLCQELNIPSTPLPQYNRSQREHYSNYYDKKLSKLVRKRFAIEIERFGYTFE
jgi:Sulfotransferase family